MKTNIKDFLKVNYSDMDSEMMEYFDLLTFLGYKLAPCSNGRAWTSPWLRVGDNPFKFSYHGLLFVENRHYDYKKLKEWSNMMDIIRYIIKKYPNYKLYFQFTTENEEGWKQIIELIKIIKGTKKFNI